MNQIQVIFKCLNERFLVLCEMYGEQDESACFEFACQFEEISEQTDFVGPSAQLITDFEGFVNQYNNSELFSNADKLFLIVVNTFLKDSFSDIEEEVEVEEYKINDLSIDFDFEGKVLTDIQSKKLIVFPNCIFPENTEKLLNFLSNIGTVEKLSIIKAMTSDSYSTLLSENNCLIVFEGTEELTPNPSIIKLLQLSSSQSIHNVIECRTNPTPIDLDISLNYNQFEDVFYVLSEYNQEVGVISKFLKLYQIFENFEIRYELVSLVNENAPNFFSVRSFSQIAKKSSTPEEKFLKQLMSNIFNQDFDGSNSINDMIVNDFASFKTENISSIPNENNLKSFLEEIGVSINNIDLIKKDDTFAQIVYKLRCSIVHNKLYELHLTDGQLNVRIELLDLLLKFIIPVLEKIIYKLISSKNDLLWYQAESINLY